MNKDYQDALERAKSIKDSIIASHNKESASYYTGFIDNIFPELKESEDERIRKEIINYIGFEKPIANKDENRIKEMIAYLEKQKEPHYSPLCNTIKDKIREYIANHFIADRVVKTDMKSIIKAMEEGVRLGKEEQQPSIPEDIAAAYQMGLAKGRNEQKPAEWSEEDENTRRDIIVRLESLLEYETQYLAKAYLQKEIDWLKSLRPQPHWKPSEEQMEALNDCVSEARGIHNASMGGYDAYPKLQSLYNDLKKL